MWIWEFWLKGSVYPFKAYGWELMGPLDRNTIVAIWSIFHSHTLWITIIYFKNFAFSVGDLKRYVFEKPFLMYMYCTCALVSFAYKWHIINIIVNQLLKNFHCKEWKCIQNCT